MPSVPAMARSPSTCRSARSAWSSLTGQMASLTSRCGTHQHPPSTFVRGRCTGPKPMVSPKALSSLYCGALSVPLVFLSVPSGWLGPGGARVCRRQPFECAGDGDDGDGGRGCGPVLRREEHPCAVPLPGEAPACCPIVPSPSVGAFCSSGLPRWKGGASGCIWRR